MTRTKARVPASAELTLCDGVRFATGRGSCWRPVEYAVTFTTLDGPGLRRTCKQHLGHTVALAVATFGQVDVMTAVEAEPKPA